jgi:nitrogen-specific signal transduction histidine kinase
MRTENTHSNSQLFFFYNIQTKEILFSSQPMEEFFGSPIDLDNTFPFTNTKQSNTQTLVNEWQYCLQLKEKESRNFHYETTLTEGVPVLFSFDAVGLNWPVRDQSPLMFCSVKKKPTKSNPVLRTKTDFLYQKDYAEFIDIAAHDLDAPLRKLSLLIERLAHKQKSEPASDMQDYFTRIQSSLSDMRSLVDSLSRLAGLAATNPVNVVCDLNIIVDDISNDLRLEARSKDFSLTSSGLPLVVGDPVQYRQLFQNLLQNASKFSKKNQPLEITITVIELLPVEKQGVGLADDKNWFMISVSDNGVGFRHEYAEKIFKPFVRLHGKSEYPGSGMGLAICKKIVENHGGIIYAQGNEASGATITLILPQSV